MRCSLPYLVEPQSFTAGYQNLSKENLLVSAELELLSAKKIVPYRLNLYNQKGDVLLIQHRPQEALHKYSKPLDLMPDDFGALSRIKCLRKMIESLKRGTLEYETKDS